MKRILAAAASLAVLAAAAPALADGPGVQTDVITINGTADALCDISSHTNTITLATGSLIDGDAFVRPDVEQQIVDGLNGLALTAWCNGAHNDVRIGRTALVRNGATGLATLPSDGFAQAVSYDVLFGIDGAVRNDQPGPMALGGLSYALDGTEDGNFIGTTTKRFGPTGNGAPVKFALNHVNGIAAPATITSGNALDDGPTSNFPNPGAVRLAAGGYTSYVTITLGPGV